MAEREEKRDTLDQLFPKWKLCIAAMFDYSPEVMRNLQPLNFGPNIIRHVLHHGQQKIVWLFYPDDEMRREYEAAE